ncbi:MAG TPA: hypothetical protein VFF19_25265 [Reyranella sp.]|nr:hypothetical protein [Reyranella sp.]
MMRWLSSITAPITVPRVGVCLQAVMVSFVVLSAFVAYSSWRAEAGKRQTDATLRYFDPLMDRECIRYLWETEEFTLCYERAAERHLSYARFKEISGKPESFKLATGWWDLIENEYKEHESCGRPPNIEEKLMMVYGRLEALASCARQKLCSFSRIIDMIEAIDHMTVLSFSNYLLLTRYRDHHISREWTMDGNSSRSMYSRAVAAPPPMPTSSTPGAWCSTASRSSRPGRSRRSATSARGAITCRNRCPGNGGPALWSRIRAWAAMPAFQVGWLGAGKVSIV